MNFFEQQDRARRNSGRLFLLLALAVISLIAITTLLVAIAFYVSSVDSAHPVDTQANGFLQALFASLPPQTFIWIALGIISVVILGGLFRFLQLQSGGRSVAEAMGGKLLSGNSNDPDERKILNIVEEMAIASGTAVPPVYLIEDQAINAFAAGYKPQDAIIGITRGCIHLLSRDELQGVIAHEFSHIFHGDMRINMRLVAVLHGILLLGLLGEFLIRGGGHGSIARSGKNKSPVAILALGAGLIVIGYTGVFFGNLIKAAVSRQREFLADASAVQFTRNPAGISGALKKIGGNAQGSQLEHKSAAEFSHMYFSQGISTLFTMMATHPPLEERIKRILPDWDGEFPELENIAIKEARLTASNAATILPDNYNGLVNATTIVTAATPLLTSDIYIEEAINHIAQPTAVHLDYARKQLNDISPLLKEAAREPFTARAVIIGLLLDRNARLRVDQLRIIENTIAVQELASLNSMMQAAANTSDNLRLPLIELALPALKQLTVEQHASFITLLQLMIGADRKVSLMEWALFRIVLHNTVPQPYLLRNRNLNELQSECRLLLSLLAHAGTVNETDADTAFVKAHQNLQLPLSTLLPRQAVKLSDVDAALELLNCIKPLQKPQLLKALSECILHDGKATIAEVELFRAIADGLDCPMPPLVNRNNECIA